MRPFQRERETSQTESPRRQEMMMQPSDLISAKINATLKILEWARGDIEPGIDGTPAKTHVALAEAFRETYLILDEAIQASVGEASGATGEPPALPIGDQEPVP